MTLSSLIVQLINGLADASSMFLVAAGLSLIFGVTRIVNFAHGSFYMLAIFIAYSLVAHIGASPLGFWGALLLAALAVALLGALVEIWCCAAFIARPNCCNCWRPLRWC